jgi:hypothetical protein
MRAQAGIQEYGNIQSRSERDWIPAPAPDLIRGSPE